MNNRKADEYLANRGYPGLFIAKAEGVYYLLGDEGVLNHAAERCLHVVRLSDLTEKDLEWKLRELTIVDGDVRVVRIENMIKDIENGGFIPGPNHDETRLMKWVEDEDMWEDELGCFWTNSKVEIVSNHSPISTNNEFIWPHRYTNDTFTIHRNTLRNHLLIALDALIKSDIATGRWNYVSEATQDLKDTLEEMDKSMKIVVS